MKKLILTLLVSFLSASAFAEEIKSDRVGSMVNIARVVQVVSLVNKPEMQVNIAVQDLGGSTDVSPSQKVFLTIYRKGEMFSTDAAFELKYVLSFNSAKRIKGGVYEINVTEYLEEGIVNVTYVIDAQKAIIDLKNVDCGGDFDCDASTNFKSSINITRK
jgi:hypothetical protein